MILLRANSREIWKAAETNSSDLLHEESWLFSMVEAIQNFYNRTTINLALFWGLQLFLGEK